MNTDHTYDALIERFCKTKMCTNFRSTSRSEKLCTNFHNFGRETSREREMNFRRKFCEIGSWRTCTWRVQTTKMCRTQSSCENSYTFSQGLSRNFVRIFVVQNLSNNYLKMAKNIRNILRFATYSFRIFYSLRLVFVSALAFCYI